LSVRGQTVLAVVAEPPEDGDAIHPVRNQLAEHPKGRILIRHAGSTNPADDHEIDQLVARARSGSARLGSARLAITVEHGSSTIETLPPPLDLEALADAERSATVARPRVGVGDAR
jgi:hypothetical protein